MVYEVCEEVKFYVDVVMWWDFVSVKVVVVKVMNDLVFVVIMVEIDGFVIMVYYCVDWMVMVEDVVVV